MKIAYEYLPGKGRKRRADVSRAYGGVDVWLGDVQIHLTLAAARQLAEDITVVLAGGDPK